MRFRMSNFSREIKVDHDNFADFFYNVFLYF